MSNSNNTAADKSTSVIARTTRGDADVLFQVTAASLGLAGATHARTSASDVADAIVAALVEAFEGAEVKVSVLFEGATVAPRDAARVIGCDGYNDSDEARRVVLVANEAIKAWTLNAWIEAHADAA